jgi:glycosyltransferase involved in cell wall biosynthesis
VFVGRAVYGKGIQYLIQALAHLGPRYRLTIVGDGWYLPALQQLTRRLGLSDRISFPGVLEGMALAGILEKATVGVLPSIFPEPSGLVVPEMRRYGLPVVITDVGGLREWADRYSSIHVAQTASAASLARAIEQAAAEAGPTLADRDPGKSTSLVKLLERRYGAGSSADQTARAEAGVYAYP